MSTHPRLKIRAGARRAAGGLAPLVALLVIAVALRLHWLRLSPRELLIDVLPDDAFYYFQIARRFALGQGITFDGVAPATGLHYGWLFLIAPFFIGAPPGAPDAIVWTLVTATLLFGVASWLLYLVVTKLTERWWLGALAAGVFAFQPWLRRESMNGLETSLSLAAIMGVIWALVRYWEEPRRPRAWVLAGALVVSFFARSDSLVIVAPACAPLLLSAATRRDAARVALAAAGAVVLASMTNVLRTGALLQSSATAVPWLFRSNWQRLHPDATSVHTQLRSVSVFGQALDMVTERIGVLPWLALGLGVGAIVAALLRDRPATRERGLLLAFVGLVVGLMSLLFVHGYVRWLPRSWYFASAPAVVLLVIAAATHALRRRRYARGIAAGVYALLALLDAVSDRPDARGPTYPWQEEMFLAGVALDSRVPPGVAVGAFNSGIVGYHTRRVVVNLDGIVNEDAARALRASRLLAYMQERSIAYVVDSPKMWDDDAFFHATRHLWGPNVPEPITIERFDVTGTGWPRSTDAIVLAKVPEAP